MVENTLENRETYLGEMEAALSVIEEVRFLSSFPIHSVQQRFSFFLSSYMLFLSLCLLGIYFLWKVLNDRND